MRCNFRLTKLINNVATFYYSRIVSLQAGAGQPMQRPSLAAVCSKHIMQRSKTDATPGSNPKDEKNKVEQLRVLRVLM
jgi:hypothetical protein